MMLLLVCLINATFTIADDIDLYPTDETGTPIHPGSPKAPVQPLTIQLNEDSLFFGTSHAEYEISLRQNGLEIFNTIIPENVESLELPSYISGECEIRLTCCGIVFVGYVII